MINEVKKAIDRALKQVRPAFRGVTSLLNTASQVSVAQIKGVASEVLNNVPVFQQFGFTSALPDNSDVIVLPLLGRSGLSVIIASENGKFRLKGLVKGETAIYDLQGKYILLKKDGGIIVEAKNQPVTVNNATVVTINASEKIKLVAPVISLNGS
ncbi:phage baseplate assembly protein domain-containing protein [Agitococcus lubricus]|uniref:Phage gp45-like n=1 Tax=Agitococcus lubricus TaxID=1077255 RepID=A0A2T5J400_9GAMM|nr:phage baseplate assembly protein [Agitococcus lubricus]PTQ91278.1 phage gp45-like [Agitococcus lubricus]